MNKVQRVERHIIKSIDKRFNAIKEVCHNSKNLYNYANYLLRQNFITQKSIPKEYELSTNLTKENQIDYRNLPSQTAGQVIKLLYKNYKSFFKSLRSYQKDKAKFTSKPKLPKYKAKNGVNVVIFTNQQLKIKNSQSLTKIYFPKTANGKSLDLKPLITKIDFKTSSLKQVRFIPKSTCFIVEVVYECEIWPINVIENSFIILDLGLNNFVTAIDNQSKQPLLSMAELLRA